MFSRTASLYLCLLISVVLLVPADLSGNVSGSEDSPVPGDSVYTLAHVRYLAGKRVSEAHTVLDSIERREAAGGYRAIPRYKIELARAFVVSRELKPLRALNYLREIFDSEELRRDTADYIMAASLMANEYYVLNRKDEAVKYALLGMETAKNAGDYASYTLQCVNFCLLYFDSAHPDEALRKVREARGTMRMHPDQCDSTLIVWSLEAEAQMYMQQNRFGEAADLYHEILSIYRRITPEARRGTEIETDVQHRFKQAQTHATIAMLNQCEGNEKNAAGHYDTTQRLMAGLPRILSPQMYGTLLSYLTSAGRDREALGYALEYEQDVLQAGDTINNYVLDAKQRLAGIYQATGNYAEAWRYEHEASVLSDSLSLRSNYATAAELAAAYDAAEKLERIHRQNVTIASNRYWITVLVIGLAGLIIFVLLVWLNSRRILRKNEALFDQVGKLGQAQQELDQIRQAIRQSKGQRPDGPGGEGTLYARLERCMQQKKLYLDPGITRERVAAELETNKLYLSNAIQENKKLTFGEYITELRLECARNILLEDNHTKIEAVSAMSGFNSVRTFYRLFQKAYRLTPSEFRNVAAQNKKKYSD